MSDKSLIRFTKWINKRYPRKGGNMDNRVVRLLAMKIYKEDKAVFDKLAKC